MDVIAQGPDRKHRWRRPLTPGQPIVLGRDSGAWSVPWDEKISRKHAELVLSDTGEVSVHQLPDAVNSIFYRGQRHRHFQVRDGEAFVIGATTFTVRQDQAAATLDLPQPFTEQTFSLDYLRRVEYRQAHRRFDILSDLPDLLAQARTETDWLMQVVHALMRGIHRATAAAVVRVEPESDRPSQLLHWDRADEQPGEFAPSEQLIRRAVERQESVVHAWRAESDAPSKSSSTGVVWAFATPVTGEASRGWALYVMGREDREAADRVARPTADPPATDADPPVTPGRGGEGSSDPFNLQDDLKYAELVASIVGSVRQLRWLERRQAALSQCFSPVVVEALASADPESALAPRESAVSVMFCDLRGFTRRSEQSADDLFGLLQRVSEALGVVTHHVLEQRGVIGDFHGDAAMGFWGWPLAQDDAVVRAALAALGIRAELQQASTQPGHPLANFQVGLGLATGQAVAGTIGTRDQVKVTAFGPVVNLAARLETMTKTLRAPVLIDAATAENVRRHVSPSVARTRRVAVVRPAGFRTPVEVSELLPPEPEFPQLADADIAAYEAGLDALLARDWSTAMACLHAVPTHDQVKDFLMVFIARHNRVPPEDWDGVIPLAEK